MYPLDIVNPIKKELTSEGFVSLENEKAVTKALQNEGSILFVINSICGCAAKKARPAILEAVKKGPSPSHLFTSFAGVDTEAVEAVRKKLFPFPPSSPSIALFKDGKLVHMLERHHIEGNEKEYLVENLTEAFRLHCKV